MITFLKSLFVSASQPSIDYENLPTTLKIGHYTFTVELMSAGESDALGAWGTCNKNECIIKLAETMSADRALDTFTHECLHALYEAYHIEPERDEEYTVTRLGTALAALYRDNPALVKWMGDRS